MGSTLVTAHGGNGSGESSFTPGKMIYTRGLTINSSSLPVGPSELAVCDVNFNTIMDIANPYPIIIIRITLSGSMTNNSSSSASLEIMYSTNIVMTIGRGSFNRTIYFPALLSEVNYRQSYIRYAVPLSVQAAPAILSIRARADSYYSSANASGALFVYGVTEDIYKS